MPTKKENPINTDWLKDTLTDAEETLARAISLIEENPQHARGVLENEIPALYAKLNYAVNTARIGPDAIERENHDALIAWPEGEDFKAFSKKK